MASAESPPHRNPDTEGSDDGESSDSDGVLFKFPTGGVFKRKVENSDDSDDSDSGGAGAKRRSRDPASDDDDDDDSDADDDDNAFNSSPEFSRVRGATGVVGAAGSGKIDDFDTLSSGDDADFISAPKRRTILDDTALKAQADAKVDDYLMSGSSDNGGGTPVNASQADDQKFKREMGRRMAAATSIETASRRIHQSFNASGTGVPSAAVVAAAAVARKAAEARSKRQLCGKRVKVRVIRSKVQQHIFNTKLETVVGAVEEGCRLQLMLLSRDERDAELALYHEGKLLDSETTLVDAGLRGDATLNLEVKGAGPVFSGPPITLKVRIDGGKTFMAETTTDTTFSTFMELFIAAVGVPPERVSEAVFKFDGDNLEPNGTPEKEDMESEELIDAKFPADLMGGIQAAPTNLKLVARPKKAKPASKKATGVTDLSAAMGASAVRRGGWGNGASAAAVAATAMPLGRTRSSRNQPLRMLGSGSNSSSGSSSGNIGGGSEQQDSDVIVID